MAASSQTPRFLDPSQTPRFFGPPQTSRFSYPAMESGWLSFKNLPAEKPEELPPPPALSSEECKQGPIAYGFFVEPALFHDTYDYMLKNLLIFHLSIYYAPEKVLFLFQVRTGDEKLDEMVKNRLRGFPGMAIIEAIAAALNVDIKWHAVEEPWFTQFPIDDGDHGYSRVLYLTEGMEYNKKTSSLTPESVAMLPENRVPRTTPSRLSAQ